MVAEGNVLWAIQRNHLRRGGSSLLIKGLEITDKQHDLVRPIFGDIALVSKKHIRQVVPLLKLNERAAPGVDPEREIIHLLESITLFKEEFHTYIAVRRTGLTSEKGFEFQIIKDSRDRAFQVAALLSLVFLSISKQRKTCALIEQFQDQTRLLTMLDLQEGGFKLHVMDSDSYTIRDQKANINTSRSNLKILLNKKVFQGLSEVLLFHTSQLPKSIQRSISQAAIRLSDAIHNTSPSAQLLGAVTSMEILLTTEEGEKYDSIRQRIVSLLGSNMANHYNAKSVFHSRHLYVHKGENVESYTIPFNAIALALSCILNYIELSKNFPDKVTFVKYLDFIHKFNDISASISEKEKQLMNRVIRTTKNVMNLPFFESVSKF